MLLLYSHFSIETFCFLFVWSTIHSIGIFFFAERKCVDLVVIFKKGSEETFAVSLQIHKTCLWIKYLTLVRPGKLIAVNFTFFFTRCKMHITSVLLKNYSFRNFLNRSNFAFVCFFSKIIFSPQKNVYGTYLNSTSNIFAYLLIIFLGHD